MDGSTTMVLSNLFRLSEARETAGLYAEEIRRHFDKRLHSIRLYGSAARGDWTPDSDIDILVLLDSVSREDSDWLISRAVSLGILGSGFLIQPIFMSVADFDRLKARERRFAIEVEEQGIGL